MPHSTETSRPSIPIGRVFICQIWRHLARYPRPLFVGLAAVLVSAACSLVIPFLVGRIAEALAQSEHAAMSIAPLIGAAALAATVGAGVNILARSHLAWLGERVSNDFRLLAHSRLLQSGTADLQELTSGEWITDLTTATNNLRYAISADLGRALLSLLIGIVAMGLLVALSPHLALLLCVALLPSLVISRYASKRIAILARSAHDFLAKAHSIAQQTFAGIHDIRAFHAEPERTARYEQALESHAEVAVKADTLAACADGAVAVLSALTLCGGLMLGAAAVASGDLEVGALVALLLYLGLVTRAAGTLVEVWGDLYAASGTASSLTSRFLDTRPTNRTATQREGAVVIRSLSYTYPDQTRCALKTLSFQVSPGEWIGVVGPSGSGKTTLAKLLVGLLQPSSGDVSIDGVPPSEVEAGAITWVAQHPHILDGTVRENLSFGRRGVTDAQIRRAGTVAHLDEFVRQLPDEYDSEVGENGARLSGGQRQRIAIARAVLSNPSVLILDEATNALDVSLEKSVLAGVRARRSDRTTIVIAHRASALGPCDKLLRLGAGILQVLPSKSLDNADCKSA